MNLFSENLDLTTTHIEGDQVHHFRNVLRGKVTDKVKLFDGKGNLAQGVVEKASKRELVVRVENKESVAGFASMEQLTIGIPKKEYLESILRTATQTGVRTVNLVQTQYSPWVFKKYARLDKILISSLLQSENPFLPELRLFDSIESFLQLGHKTLLFSTELQEAIDIQQVEGKFENIFIGPEGGFHQRELEIFNSSDHITSVRLSAPIMKAETAASYCLGLASLLK